MFISEITTPYCSDTDDDKRKIDDPGLNQDSSTYDKDEDFEDTDDFHKYDDTADDPQDS